MSARWRRGYNPDLAFVSFIHYPNFEKSVCDPIPKSQHRPLSVSIRPVLRATVSQPMHRFNYRKAKWECFTPELDDNITNFEPIPENYEPFKKLVWETSRKHIPRGCRKNYIPCITEQGKEIYEKYI